MLVSCSVDELADGCGLVGEDEGKSQSQEKYICLHHPSLPHQQHTAQLPTNKAHFSWDWIQTSPFSSCVNQSTRSRFSYFPLSLFPALLIVVKLSRSDRGQPSIIVATRLHPHSINIAEHWSVVSDQPWYYPTTIQFLHSYYSNNLRCDDLSHQDVGGIF